MVSGVGYTSEETREDEGGGGGRRRRGRGETRLLSYDMTIHFSFNNIQMFF